MKTLLFGTTLLLFVMCSAHQARAHDLKMVIADCHQNELRCKQQYKDQRLAFEVKFGSASEVKDFDGKTDIEVHFLTGDEWLSLHCRGVRSEQALKYNRGDAVTLTGTMYMFTRYIADLSGSLGLENCEF